MSYYDILLAKQLSGGGGGGDITVESLSVTANGTYSAPSGKAYSPVVANVPNSYTASDEGKVVSSGALVAQTSQSITANGTYDTTLKNSVTVNVSGGGGGASNVVKGTLYATSAGIVDVALPYTGNGYPILVAIYPKGGAEGNTEFADLLEQGAYRYYIRIKTNMNTAPSSAVATQSFGIQTSYKTNGTSATRYTNGGGGSSAIAYFDKEPTATDSFLIYFRSANSLAVYVGGTTTTGHLALNTEYEYLIVYSE